MRLDIQDQVIWAVIGENSTDVIRQIISGNKQLIITAYEIYLYLSRGRIKSVVSRSFG